MQQAKLDIKYQQLVYENQRMQVNTFVLIAYREYEQQRKALILEEENILLAKENVSIALEVYRLGGSTIIQLREAQKSLEDAYNRLIDARYNTKLSETTVTSCNMSNCFSKSDAACITFRSLSLPIIIPTNGMPCLSLFCDLLIC